jgi:hypothetical protein
VPATLQQLGLLQLTETYLLPKQQTSQTAATSGPWQSGLACLMGMQQAAEAAAALPSLKKRRQLPQLHCQLLWHDLQHKVLQRQAGSAASASQAAAQQWQTDGHSPTDPTLSAASETPG